MALKSIKKIKHYVIKGKESNKSEFRIEGQSFKYVKPTKKSMITKAGRVSFVGELDSQLTSYLKR